MAQPGSINRGMIVLKPLTESHIDSGRLFIAGFLRANGEKPMSQSKSGKSPKTRQGMTTSDPRPIFSFSTRKAVGLC
ncbi:hypothetical protein BDDG_09566 [Blastomyces dermatitidis ATCC 18188]|uniref:Uncharacterized protein n=1 Tax=Ajellomyces dermatitidis (strain ATCC 18188 / CBS 674.68) TaxID=653446 RepID=F2TTQ6_AJEDA|nr:hypothetical protein BDDG_09566 [Blastomyces dermatitidis ATCC 18188]